MPRPNKKDQPFMLPLGTIGRTKFRPYMTFTLIIICVLVYFVELIVSLGGYNAMEQFFHNYALAACRVGTDPFLLTLRNATFTMFLHSPEPLHLIGNMVFLRIFAPRVEAFFGHWRFLAVYLIVGWLASVAHVALGVQCAPGTYGILVGASGAIAGVMGAFFWLYPGTRVRTLVLIRVIPIPAFIFLLIWVGIDVFQLLTVPSMVAHWAHIGGFIAGVALLFMITMFVPAPKVDPLEHLDA
jgi:membrane associated rhomboid family serine protease